MTTYQRHNISQKAKEWMMDVDCNAMDGVWGKDSEKISDPSTS